MSGIFDKNFDPDATLPAESELANQDIDRSVDEVLLPLTNSFVPVTSGAQAGLQALNGDVTFNFSTGKDEWIQISKSFLGVDYQVKADDGTAAAVSYPVALAPCLFNSARFEIEGQRICYSNNYTVDWALSNRLQFSGDYNASINELMYTTAAAGVEATALTVGPMTTTEGAQTADTPSKYTSIDNLAALFYRTENLLLPPNTHYRFTFTPEPYEVYKQKTLLGDTRDAALQSVEISLNRIYLNLHRIRWMKQPTNFSMRFLTIETNSSTPTTTSHNIQYQVSSRMRKCGVFMVSTASRTAAAVKKYNETRFRYASDVGDIATTGIDANIYARGLGSILANGLARLQMRAGTLLMPNQMWDFTRAGSNGLKAAYLHFLNSVGKYNDNGKPETFQQWLNQGPIYIEDAVKGDDLSTNLQVEASFVAAPAAQFYVFQVNETIIGFTWDSDIPKFAHPTTVLV